MGEQEPRSKAPDLWRAFAKALDKQCAALAYVYTQETDLPSTDGEKELKICAFDAESSLLNDPSKTASGRDASPEERQLVLKHWMSLGSVMGSFSVIVVRNLKNEERMNVFLGLVGQGTPADSSWSYVTSETSENKPFHAAFVRSPWAISHHSTWAFESDMFFDSPPLQVLVSKGDDAILLSVTSLGAEEREVFFESYDERAISEFRVSGIREIKKKKMSVAHVVAGRGLQDNDEFLLQAPCEAIDNVLLDVKTTSTTPHECSMLKLASKPEEAPADFGLNDVYPVVVALET